MDEVLKKIQSLGLMAVIRASGPQEVERIVEALVAGGVTGIEVTFTTPDALEAVEDLADQYGDRIVLGMGTLTRPEHARQAREVGAQFLVSPHIEEELARAMAETQLPYMMGALTPTEIVRAYRLGCRVVKVFPGSLVGPGYLKSLRGPYPEVAVMPTGGVNLDNLADWMAAGAFAVGVGSGLFPHRWVQEGLYSKITERAEAFQSLIQSLP